MKFKLYIALFLLVFPAQGIFAQDVPFEKDFFKDRKPEFKEALKELRTGDELYIQGQSRFRDALTYYISANNFNPNNAELNYKIGKCYILGSLTKSKSIKYFEKALELNSRVSDDIHYMLGHAYHLDYKWDKAINEYMKHQKTLSADANSNTREKVKKRIEECETGKQLMASPTRVFIDNLGGTVNSKYPEYGAIINADESIMLFTSRRDNTTGGKKDEFINEYYEDIYITHKVNGQWGPPENMGKPVNTDGHDATVGLSPDGQSLLVYKDDKGDGNIYGCYLKGIEWSKPKKLDKTINSPYHEPSAWFSYDGNSLYFVSARPEGSMGGKDIYISHWDPEGERWGPATNLGPPINTKYDEDAIFVHPDGKTIYFSSKGHKTMGGYDIFKSEQKDGRWQEPENIGYPVNTPDDDVFFVMNASGKRGYYSSFSEDGHGEKDIFVITFLGPEKPLTLNNEDNLIASLAAPVKETVIEPAVQVSRNKVTILKGIVRNAVTLKPVEASIELIDNEKSEMVANFMSNSTSGKYLVSLPSGKNYGIAVKSPGYLFHSENFIIPESAAYMEVEKNINLNELKVGSTVILKNIFFDFDKFTLRPESTKELENVEQLLNDNPTLKVEISGHTDNKGSDTYNQQLSENRAKAVVEYLEKKGVSKARMSYKGYGESVPIATNDNDEGRQLNRRTEFKIVAM